MRYSFCPASYFFKWKKGFLPPVGLILAHIDLQHLDLLAEALGDDGNLRKLLME
jgi:hypothetical protein